MTRYIQKPFAGESDFEQVVELFLAARTGKFLYRYPTFWRLELLLTNKSAQRVFLKAGFQPYEADICGWRSYSAHR